MRQVALSGDGGERAQAGVLGRAVIVKLVSPFAPALWVVVSTDASDLTNERGTDRTRDAAIDQGDDNATRMISKNDDGRGKLSIGARLARSAGVGMRAAPVASCWLAVTSNGEGR